MAAKNQKQAQAEADAQANATEPNEGVTHDVTSDAPAQADQAQASAKTDDGVRVGFGKYLKEMMSLEVVIGGETYREGDRVSEDFLDSDANKAPSGGKYLVKKGGE